jgi:altronate hydrolase
MKSNAIRVTERDTVAVAARAMAAGDAVIVDGQHVLDAAQDIPLGHKVALVSFQSGQEVLRYGEPIVRATQEVQAGEWVHLHNTEPILREL